MYDIIGRVKLCDLYSTVQDEINAKFGQCM